MSKSKLTPKQKAFCVEYIKSGNATQSYMAVYNVKNENTAAVNATRMLRNAKVIDYLQKYANKLDQKRIASIEEVQEWWTKIFTGKVKVADIKDRLKASELLVKSRGGFLEKVSLTNENDIKEIKISFVDKSKPKTGREQDPKIIGDYTKPLDTEE